MRDPTLAFTAVLAPVRRFALTAPPLPERLQDLFGKQPEVELDPVEAILHGPIPRRRLASASGWSDTRAHLQGLGDALAVTAVVAAPGEHERLPTARLRDAATSIIVFGLPEDDDASPPAPAGDLAAALTADPRWSLLGFVEVSTSLIEGIAEDAEAASGWGASGTVRIGRARGVGGGHAAWTVRGHYTRESEFSVAERRLSTLREGFGAAVAPTVEYGAAALRWGLSSRRALRQAGALDDLVETLRASVSESVTRGEAPSAELAARLEHLRVGLVEEIESLRGLRPRLASASARVFGDAADADGPFAEAGAAGEQVLGALADREASASRWAGVLRAASAL